MQIIVKSGDILNEPVDVLICSANVYLNLSGGVGATILQRGGGNVQKELHDHLKNSRSKYVAAGSIIRTTPGPLPFKTILHVVSIDAFYQTSIEFVRKCIENALAQAAELSANSVALPALATGYGPLSVQEFAEAAKGALSKKYDPIDEIRIVLRREHEARQVREAFRA